MDDLEFNDMHKDSFVRGKPNSASKSPAAKTAPKAPPSPPKKKEGTTADDFVPDNVGKVVDNVFGKLDNLVNDAADYLFGGKKKPGEGLTGPDTFAKQKAPAAIPPLAPPPIPQVKPIEVPKPAPQPVPAPMAAAPAPPGVAKAPPKQPTITQISTLRGAARAQQTVLRAEMPEAQPHIQGPVIARTTSIAELDLPLELLDDPDLKRYFDQMKLYETQVVPGGLCNMSQYEATHVLKRGSWNKKFTVAFEDLRGIEPGINPLEMAKSRFAGMRPVYKATAWQFNSRETLIKAIVEDINAYLAGKQGKVFHRYIYQVASKRY
jgi:hypothetical protein